MSVSTEEESPQAEGRVRRRRRWSRQEKRRIVAETFEPGASVSVVARRHDVNANQVFTWRRQLRDEALGDDEGCAFVPVVVPAESPAYKMPAPEGETQAPADGVSAMLPALAGRMEVVLSGGRRVIVDKTVNAAALARVIGVLERR